MLFIYLYHGNLYSDSWKGDLYFRPATIPELSQLSISNVRAVPSGPAYRVVSSVGPAVTSMLRRQPSVHKNLKCPNNYLKHSKHHRCPTFFENPMQLVQFVKCPNCPAAITSKSPECSFKSKQFLLG